MSGVSPRNAPGKRSLLAVIGEIPPKARWRYWLVSLGALLLSTLVMWIIGAPLVNDTAPKGIICFELAGSLPEAQKILGSWSPQVRMAAALSLGVDYLYIPVYAASLGLLCGLAALEAQRLSRFGASVGLALAWGMLGAGAMDAVENFALIRVLFGDISVLWVKTAWLCASLKFLWIGLAVLFVLITFFARVFAWVRHPAGE